MKIISLGKKVFISGASGLIGSNCLNHFKACGHQVLGSHFSFPTENTSFFNTLNLDDPNNLDLQSFQPDVIVHCGALTWVDYCEEHPKESYEKTVESSLQLIKLANSLGAKLVYIGTDYVFDGKEGPYTEDAKTNPLSIYGEHKLAAEEAILNDSPNNLSLRVTNVYGDEIRNKNFIARIVQQALEGEDISLKLPLDQYATPVNAIDVARAMELLINDNKTGVYHIASTDYVNRVQLALRVLKYFPDAKYSLSTSTTKDLNQAADRPLLGGLISKRLLTEYPDFEFSNVDDYLSSIIADKI